MLREELGGTYSVGVGYSNTAPQPGYGTTQIQFGSSPENVDKLVAAVLAEVDKLRRDGPTAAEVATSRRRRRTTSRGADAERVLAELAAVGARDGARPAAIPRRREHTDLLTPQNIHAAAQKYLPADRYTVLSLLPETTATPTTK